MRKPHRELPTTPAHRLHRKAHQLASLLSAVAGLDESSVSDDTKSLLIFVAADLAQELEEELDPTQSEEFDA